MKLAVIMPPVYTMPPVSGGGIERLADTFCRQNESAAEPLDITVFSRGEEKDAPENPYIHTKFTYINVTRSEPPSNRFDQILHGDKNGTRFDYLKEIQKHLKAEKFDRILLEDCFEFAKYLDGEKILHAHHRFFDLEKSASDRGADKAIGFRKRFDKVNKFIFPSEFMKKQAVSLGVPDGKCSIVHDAVDLSVFDPERFSDVRAEKRAKYRLGDDDILGVFVGRLTPERGAVEIVKAVASSEYQASAMKLLIVGSSEYGADIRDEYREQLESAAPAVDFQNPDEQFAGKVIFIGSVKARSTARFLSRADFAVVPSVADEAGGLPALEAMACGLPLVISDSGALAEYVGELAGTDNCIVVKRGLGYAENLRRAIDKLSDDLHEHPEKRGTIAKNAREHSAGFSGDKFYAEMRDVIG